MGPKPGVRIRCLECGSWSPRVPVPASTHLACTGCGKELVSIPAEAAVVDGRVDRCLHCGRDRFWLRRDFEPKKGLWIVAAGAVLAPFTHYISLGVTALLDFILHALLPDVTLCYWCDSEYRGFAKNPVHRVFDLHVAERFSRPGKYRSD